MVIRERAGQAVEISAAYESADIRYTDSSQITRSCNLMSRATFLRMMMLPFGIESSS